MHVQTALDQQKNLMALKKEELDKNKNELRDINKMLTTMNEAKSKFGKNCDEKAIKEIKRIMGSGSSTAVQLGRDILDGICLLVKDSPDATWSSHGQDVFESAEAFNKCLRKADMRELEKGEIKKLADKVNCKDNVKGDILARITQDTNTLDNVPFFPFFKVLYKLCQIGMTLRTKRSFERKQHTIENEMADIQVEVDKHQAVYDSYNMHQRYTAEIERSQNDEIRKLQEALVQMESEVQNL